MAELRLPLSPLSPGLLTLDAATARYLTRVRRASAGDRFLAFDPVARLQAVGHIEQVSRQAVIVRLAAPGPAEHVPQQPLILIQGLPKGAKLDAIVRDATELGATHILATRCERSQPPPLSRAHHARCQRISSEAARQSGRGDIPELSSHASLPLALAWCRAHHPAAAAAALHPHASGAFCDWASSATQAAIVAIGPEGGFSDDELSALAGADFSLVRLGQFVLRTETAPTAALGALIAQLAR